MSQPRLFAQIKKVCATTHCNVLTRINQTAILGVFEGSCPATALPPRLDKVNLEPSAK
jgi:hypothetical protein